MQSQVSYTASGGQTIFSVTFAYLSRDHVHVYINDVETDEFAWLNSAVIILDNAASNGDEILIRRLTPRDEALVNFSNGSTLGESDLDAALAQSLYIAQEMWEQAESAYPAGHSVFSHTDTEPTSVTTEGALARFNEFGKLESLPIGTDGQTLEVDDLVDGKISWQQGLRKLAEAAGDFLYATASGVFTRLAVGAEGAILTVVNGLPAWRSAGSAAFSTGDAKLSIKISADAGWVKCDDGTIGDGSSGASTRANDDCEDLFLLLWINVSDTYAPVTGGRGATAAADWAAHKKIALTKQLGRALIIAGAGSGLTSRSLGQTGGSEDAVNVTHTHSVTDPGHAHTVACEPVGVVGVTSFQNGSTAPPNPVTSSTAVTGISIQNSGVSGTGANMQPYGAWNIFMKL
jgi:hypothetical protein